MICFKQVNKTAQFYTVQDQMNIKMHIDLYRKETNLVFEHSPSTNPSIHRLETKYRSSRANQKPSKRRM